MSLKGKAKAFGMGFEEEEDPVRSFSLFFFAFFALPGKSADWLLGLLWNRMSSTGTSIPSSERRPSLRRSTFG